MHLRAHLHFYCLIRRTAGYFDVLSIKFCYSINSRPLVEYAYMQFVLKVNLCNKSKFAYYEIKRKKNNIEHHHRNIVREEMNHFNWNNKYKNSQVKLAIYNQTAYESNEKKRVKDRRIRPLTNRECEKRAQHDHTSQIENRTQPPLYLYVQTRWCHICYLIHESRKKAQTKQYSSDRSFVIDK